MKLYSDDLKYDLIIKLINEDKVKPSILGAFIEREFMNEKNIMLSEKLGFVIAMNFIIRESGLPYEQLMALVDKMNEEIKERYKTY